MKFNINKFFTFLSIRKKLIIAFSLLSSVPILIFGIIGIFSTLNNMRDVAFENLSHDVAISNERVQNFINNVTTDINYLVNKKELDRFLTESNYNSHSRLDDNQYLKNISDYAQAKGIYYQFRLLNSNGEEKFRVKKDKGEYRIFKTSELRLNIFQFYLVYTENLPENNFLIIPSELVGQNNSRIPVISFIIKFITKDKEHGGLFIADVYAEELFKILDDEIHFSEEKEVVIVNTEGNYLYHSKFKNDWNTLLASKAEQNLFANYSNNFIDTLFSKKKGIFDDGFGDIIAYAPMSITRNFQGNEYYIFERVGNDFIFSHASKFALISLGIILLFLMVSISLGFIATNQIAKPIKKLREGAEIISKGNYKHKLEINTNDEIELLAEQFNNMASSLGEREELLKRHRDELEKTVSLRTKELKKEKEILQAIMDNVPSAFILVDKSCRILAASKNIEKFYGINFKSILGKKCSSLEKGIFFRAPEIIKNRKMNNIDVHVEVRNDNELSEKYFEHISVPVVLEAGNKAVLEIISDITERKKSEEHQIKLEKIVTIGETTSLIAHEIRNSLTSVKMLLQLEKENRDVNYDVSALDTSLGSIFKIEKVVNNLLAFSKPFTPEFSKQNINKIIDDALVFMTPQLKKNKIVVDKKFNQDILEIPLDENLIREAIINLIVNANQAIGSNGKIIIKTNMEKLTLDSEDYSYTDYHTLDLTKPTKRVLIHKGSEIISIKIEDNANGIPVNEINKIFDPFFTTKKNGSGLGLAMVKRTINQHGGIIYVNSKVGVGTSFVINLPLGNSK